MANILDYIAWRGDLSLQKDGWNDIDALILANLCYCDLRAAAGLKLKDAPPLLPEAGAEGLMKQHLGLLKAAGESRRFAEVAVTDSANNLDAAKNIQFAASVMDAPDGMRVIAFRGTDGTLTGWREDFSMAYEKPVPAQLSALEYLTGMASEFQGPVMLTGHSKGGNLALYAAAHAPREIQDRLVAVYSFDGPGLDEESMTSERYERISRLVHSFVPQSSVVGMLLSYHPDYLVVKSTEHGLQQHNAYSWQVAGPRFVTLSDLNRSSKVVDQALRSWLKECTPQQRQTFVDTVFDVLGGANVETFSDMKRNIPATAAGLIEAARKVDQETGRMLTQIAGKLVMAGAGSLFDQLIRPEPNSKPR